LSSGGLARTMPFLPAARKLADFVTIHRQARHM
jgi:hypothetical protein